MVVVGGAIGLLYDGNGWFRFWIWVLSIGIGFELLGGGGGWCTLVDQQWWWVVLLSYSMVVEGG